MVHSVLRNILLNIHFLLLSRWSTHWFRLEYEIPAEWKGEEIHLIWDTGSEALVWKDGKPLQVNMVF